ncbi:type II toxin-antitoxin system HicA family toxin [Spirosoma endophyticum]|uniref:Predicted RNA binding protein YcfA, dsRBD-like fold, HicA-like mRNA interferase family n=1 Tax=Spirosoma endophyticum TaxID=662367 RepID=A0A1I1YLM7_9BACT|nr:type II toxin-antitoxin system HicA family toxin [Spirosoma endophyticum]SFE20446.1 Predicted RNA binding protein YcfA, dsRBD-like fold, HicA-like mRNA interferase family [Spirosoma endophyticum]
MAMKVREVIKLLEEDGWYLKRQSGSHRIYRHPTKPGIAVVPDHGLNKELKPGTEQSILKQAGLKQ